MEFTEEPLISGFVPKSGSPVGKQVSEYLLNAAPQAQVVTVLYRMAGSPAVEGEMPFADVAEDAWYRDAVTWAVEAGVMTGYSETEFGPDDYLTREQLAAVLYRHAVWSDLDVSVGEDTNLLSYRDVDQVSQWAVEAMQWAVGTGILTGSNGCLMPDGHATRAQCAVILMRYCQLEA